MNTLCVAYETFKNFISIVMKLDYQRLLTRKLEQRSKIEFLFKINEARKANTTNVFPKVDVYGVQ